MFTPDFSHFLNYNYNRKQWFIRPTDPSSQTAPQDRDVYIPEDFMSTVFKDQERNKGSPEFLASRMYLATKNHLRVINTDGVDCVYNIHSQEVETYAKVPGIDTENYMDQHFFVDKMMTIKYEDMAQMKSVTARIIAMNNEFTQAAALKAELFDNQIDHRESPAYDKGFIKRAVNWDLYMNNISKLSYQFDRRAKVKRFYAEKSFVLLDWLIIERIFHDPHFFDNEFS